MGAAFTENPVTLTRSHGGAKDSNPLVLANLAGGGAINTPGALSGTTGVDCKLVHGNRWEEIDGDETDHITGTLKVTIDGDENRLLLGNLETTVMQKTKDDRFGLYLGQYFAASTFNYWHTRTENHTAQEQEHQPTEHNEVINGENKEKEKSWEAAVHKEEAVAISLGAKGISVEALATGLEIFGAKTGAGLIEATGLVWRHKAEALESKLDGFIGRGSAAEVEAGGPDSAIRPIFVGILVAVHIDSPFA